MRKANQEELGLGLDPSKYAKKPWNPYDFIGKTREVVAPVSPTQEISLKNQFSGEMDAAINKAHQDLNPWSVEVPKNPQLYQDFIEAKRANPDLEDLVTDAYNEATRAKWEDDENADFVPPEVQTLLFNDWLSEDIEKHKNKKTK